EIVRVEMGKTNVNLSEAMELNGNMGLYDAATNQGRETKRTRSIANDLLHPDQMKELQNIPEYDPSRDYRERPQTTVPTQPSTSTRRTSATRTSTARNATPTRSNAAESRRPAIPAAETEGADEPMFLLMDDDSTARSTRRDEAVRAASAERRSTATKVARAETEANRSTARKPASEKTTEASRSTARKPASEKTTETSRSTARKPASEKTTEASRSAARKPASEQAAAEADDELPPLKNPLGFAVPWSRSDDEKSDD
ncbi:MAG: hypothetical protein IJY15_10490, partial [Thermoguttaceae bacterium]|nr:hypothetical protein [Thermoguttaceae bacterium]